MEQYITIFLQIGTFIPYCGVLIYQHSKVLKLWTSANELFCLEYNKIHDSIIEITLQKNLLEHKVIKLEDKVGQLIFTILQERGKETASPAKKTQQLTIDKIEEKIKKPYDNSKRIEKKIQKESETQSIFPQKFKDPEPTIIVQKLPQKPTVRQALEDDELYLTMKEAAEFAHVSDVTIYTWRKQDKIKSYLVTGKNGFFYKGSELEKIMKEGTNTHV